MHWPSPLAPLADGLRAAHPGGHQRRATSASVRRSTCAPDLSPATPTWPWTTASRTTRSRARSIASRRRTARSRRTTPRYWRDEAMPALREIYAFVDGDRRRRPRGRAAGGRVARCLGPDRRSVADPLRRDPGRLPASEDLSDFYERDRAEGRAGRGDGAHPGRQRRAPGRRGRASRRWSDRIAADRSPAPTGCAQRPLPGARGDRIDRRRSGPPRSARFLDEHGHLGQTFDDLALPSWAEEPSILLAELAKRLADPPERHASSGVRGCERTRRACSRRSASACAADDPTSSAELERRFELAPRDRAT